MPCANRIREALPRPALSALVAAVFLSTATGAAIAQQRATLPRAGTQPLPQQGARQSPDGTADLIARSGGFSASVEMVRVPVIVVDKGGAFVENLEPTAFAVRDGGKRHAVDHFVSDAEPVSVGILLDASSAMRDYEDDVLQAVARIANNLRADDELFLVAYGPSVAMLQEPTSNKGAVVAAMSDYASWDGADRALYDALDRGLSALESSRYDKRSLIVIGAGGDTASALGEVTVQQHIHRTGVTIHAISLAPRSARVVNSPSRVNRLQTLPEMVEFTGGLLARRPELTGRYGGTAGWLAAAGNDISTYVKHQYLLHYAPQSPPRPGTWREIRVVVAGEHKEIRARSGYVR
jgi:VWFA-related protein